MRIENEVLIRASIDDVWALTIDVESLPEITPTMTSVRRLDGGPIDIGSTAVIKQPGQRERTWTVTTIKPPHEFAWTTRFLGTRMVGAHELEPVTDGCRCRLSIELTGPSAGLVKAIVGTAIANAIATENAGLKRAAETPRARTGRTRPRGTLG